MRYDEDYEYDFLEDLDDEGIDTAPCPYCGMEIYAEADVCPYCGSFVFMEDVRTKKPDWLIWTAWLLIFVFAMFLFWRFL